MEDFVWFTTGFLMCICVIGMLADLGYVKFTVVPPSAGDKTA